MESNRRIEELSQVQDPKKVKVLILADQKTNCADFYLFNRFINIVKLDLSHNKLNNFPAGFNFRSFPKLRILLLHHNKFASIKSVHPISECPILEYLTLFGNPLEQTKTRHYFINQMANLKLMDNKIVRMEERNPEIVLKYEHNIDEIAFPIVRMEKRQNSAYFLATIIAQLKLVRQNYLKVNPVIRIQRWFRRKLKQNKIKLFQQQSERQFQVKSIQEENVKVDVENSQINQKLQLEEQRKKSQGLILSLFQMNCSFLKVLKEKSSKKIFALKQFCIANDIQYQGTSKKLYCLRVPNQQALASKKNGIQFIIHSNEQYIARRKGTGLPMQSTKQYSLLAGKRRSRQPSYFKKSSQYKGQSNAKLSNKLQDMRQKYSNKIVLVTQESHKIYELMRKSYYKCLRSNTIFPFLLEQLLQRLAATVSIQRMWRGYSVRKKLNSFKVIKQNHAAWLIQRFIRRLGFMNRNKMFTDFIMYAKTQGSQQSLIMKIEDVYELPNHYKRVQSSINFCIPDQKLRFGFLKKTQQICLEGPRVLLPKYLFQYAKIQMKPMDQSIQFTNVLDILFKGAKSVKYLPNPNQKSASTIERNKSTGKIKQSIEILSRGNGINLKQSYSKTKQNQLSNSQQSVEQNSNKYVIIEYKSAKQAMNRKFIIGLITHKICTHNFVKSSQIQYNKNTRKMAKNINEKINECIILAPNHQQYESQDEVEKDRIQNKINKFKQSQIKLKLFIRQYDLSMRVLAFYYSPGEAETQTHAKINSQDSPAQYYQQDAKNFKQEKRSDKVRNALSYIVPRLEVNNGYSARKVMTYQEFEQSFNKNYKSHRYDHESHNNLAIPIRSQDSITEKIQAFKSSRNENESQDSNFMKFSQLNLTQKLRSRLVDRLESFKDENEQEDKKREIIELKIMHKLKLQQNERYRREELIKIRERMSSQLQNNKKMVEESKIQNILANARKHNRVKKALRQNISDIGQFEKNFMLRGNYSMKRQMKQFESGKSQRNSFKFSDNESIYASMRSLKKEHMKNDYKHSVIGNQDKILSLKTQIKQFSIKGTQFDNDMSIQLANSKQKASYPKVPQLKAEKHERYASSNVYRKNQSLQDSRQKNKKKPVHSVFPQQFYPLKQRIKIGFQLPRISKR